MAMPKALRCFCTLACSVAQRLPVECCLELLLNADLTNLILNKSHVMLSMTWSSSVL